MVGSRKYDDACAVALALDIVGDRWALLVIRELILGPKRFSDLRAALPGVSADVLTQRLRDLSTHDVIRQRRLPPPAASKVYELTRWGAELDDVVMALARWSQSGELTQGRPSPISVDSVMLSMRVRFDPLASAELPAELFLIVDGVPYEVSVRDHQLHITRAVELTGGRASSVRLTSATMLSLVSGRSTVDQENASGHITLDGDDGSTFRAVLATLRPDPPPTVE